MTSSSSLRAVPGVIWGGLLVTAFLAWRVSIGADIGDGAHVVALAMRMAQGDLPLSDEMNLQALGSVPAVPFVWLWMKFFGVEGIVLASRYFYLVLVTVAAITGYRALRTALVPLAAFTAVVLMFTPAPYGLMVTSYNTVPALGFGLAVCAAFASLRTSSARWGTLAGASIALAVLAHPSSLPPAAVLALTVLLLAWHRRRVLWAVLLAGGAMAVLALLVIAAGPGLSSLLATISYTTEYQASRPSPWTRLENAGRRYWDGLLSWRHVPALALATLALLPGFRSSWRCAAVIGIAPAFALAAWAVVPPEMDIRQPFGLTSGAHVLLVVPLLFLPVLLRAHRGGRRDVLLLGALSAPLATVGVVSYSMVSSAGVVWGVAVPPVLPLFGALGAGLVLWARERGSTALAVVAAVAMVAGLLAVHPLRTLTNPDPRQMSGRIAAGPSAGLLTDAHRLKIDCQLRALTRDWTDPEQDSVFFYDRAGGYAYTTARMDTNIIWVSDFGAANRRTVEWWERTDRWPDVAVISPSAVIAAGSWEALATEDPLIAALDESYGPPLETHSHLVMRRDGETRPIGEAPAGCAEILP